MGRGVILVMTLFVGSGVAAAHPMLPGPGPRPEAAGAHAGKRAQSNASCVGCHPDVAAEWRGSLHKQAFVDPVFQKAYEVEPVAFCRGCHAPESDPAKAPSKLAIDIGVGCVTCHVQSGEVVGVRPASGAALHPVFADARLATQAACASCHQFDFPADSHQVSAIPMQDTVREHAASSKSKEPCQSCHMPTVDGPEGRHKSHAFKVIGDPAMIRRAVEVTAERQGGARVIVTLQPAGAGHAFPTGDMFRRLELRAEAIAADGRVLARAPSVVLARTFTDVPRDPAGRELTFQRVEAEDTRVPAPGTGPAPRIALDLPSSEPGARVRWRVLYQRMSTPMAEAFKVSQVLDEIVVAEGVLPPLQLSKLTGGMR